MLKSGRKRQFAALGLTILWGATGWAASVGCDAGQHAKQAAAHVGRGQYAEAEAEYGRSLECAIASGDKRRINNALNNVGGAALLQHQYGKALESFVRARELARESGARETEAIAWSNLAAVHILMGAGDAADAAIGAALRVAPEGSEKVRRVMPDLMAQRVRVAVHFGDEEQALELWRRAMEVAQRAGDLRAERQLWGELGKLARKQGRLEGAEEALANELRLVRLHKLPNPDFVLTEIGRLRLAMKRPEEALGWFERAEAARRAAPSPATRWAAAYDKASAIDATGRKREALEAYRESWRLALAWRHEVVPSQTALAAADVTLSGLAERTATLAMEMGQGGGGEKLVEEAWAVVEQSRASALRRMALQRPAVLRRLGPGYKAALASLQEALISEPKGRVTEMQARVIEEEARAGLAERVETDMTSAPAGELRRRVQAVLGEDQALFTFLLSEPRSYVWALTNKRLDKAELPGRAALTAALKEFRGSVSGNRGDLEQRGRSLYGVLFGGLPAETRSRKTWLLSQDGTLLQFPMAALRTTDGGRERYLVEGRTLRSLPSALWVLNPAKVAAPGRLLAVGDAVHNGADARLAAVRPAFVPLSFWLLPWRRYQAAPLGTAELPALASSRGEIESLARLWRGAGREVTLLAGMAATRAQVEEQLGGTPGVVHFATHVVAAPALGRGFLLRLGSGRPAEAGSTVAATPEEAILMLSIQADGMREGISTGMISQYEAPGALVVLNGCSSGTGTVERGAGLFGFTRAWLAAGARTVVASLWPVTDDENGLFEHFYRGILSGNDASKALASAQTACIHSRTWRAEPRYWAAYFPMGKE